MRSLRIVVSLAVVSIAVTGCGATSNPADPATTTVAVRLSNDLHTLDPHHAYSSDAVFAAGFAYDTLLANVDGELQPAIATEWEVSADSISLRLRDDITCADGSALTAETVARNVERIVDSENPARLATTIFGSLDVTATADDAANTVQIDLAQPYGDLLSGMSRVFIVCEGGLDDAEQLESASFGTGPFELKESVSGDHYTYSARAAYTELTPGLSASNRPGSVKLTLVENDSTAANLLLAGQLDLGRVDGPDRGRLNADQALQNQIVTANSFALIYNEHDGRPTSDESVRLALATAIDRASLAAAAGGEFARLADTFLAPEATCFDAGDEEILPVQDREAALAEFAAAGYELTDGKLVKDGEQLTVTLAIWDAQAAAVDYLIDVWTDLGVRVEGGALPGTRLGEVLETASGWDVSLSNLKPHNAVQNMILFSGPTPPDGLNYGNVQNPIYNELGAEASRQVTADACDLWVEANQSLLSRSDLIPIYWEDTSIYSSGLDYTPVPDQVYGIHAASLSLSE